MRDDVIQRILLRIPPPPLPLQAQVLWYSGSGSRWAQGHSSGDSDECVLGLTGLCCARQQGRAVVIGGPLAADGSSRRDSECQVDSLKHCSKSQC